MNQADELQQLIENPVFDHINVTCPDKNSLRIYFGRVSLINNRNIKWILLYGIGLPIAGVILGLLVRELGFARVGTAFLLFAAMILLLAMTSMLMAVTFGTVMQLPDEILMDSRSLTWKCPHRKITIPWMDLLSVPAPRSTESSPGKSDARNALLLTTVNGTFKALPMRSEKSCDYVAKLIYCFAQAHGLPVKQDNSTSHPTATHFPSSFEERKKYRYKGPIVCLLVAGIFGWMAVSEIQEFHIQRSWMINEAQIIDIATGENDGNTTKEATYSYTVNGQVFQGSYYWQDIPAYDHTIEPLRDLVVEIKVNPDDPSKSKISRSVDWPLLAAGAFFSSLFVVAAVWYWKSSFAPRQDAEKYESEVRN